VTWPKPEPEPDEPDEPEPDEPKLEPEPDEPKLEPEPDEPKLEPEELPEPEPDDDWKLTCPEPEPELDEPELELELEELDPEELLELLPGFWPRITVRDCLGIKVSLLGSMGMGPLRHAQIDCIMQGQELPRGGRIMPPAHGQLGWPRQEHGAASPFLVVRVV